MLRELLIKIGIEVEHKKIEKLNKEFSRLIKNVKKLDDDKIEKIDKGFENLVVSTKDVNKNLKKTEKHFKDINKSMKDISKNAKEINKGLNRIEDGAEGIGEAIQDAEEHTEDMTKGFKDANKQAEKLAGTLKDAEKQVSSLTRETGKLENAFKDIQQAASRLNSELNGISFGGLQSEISRLESAFSGIVQAAQRAASETASIGTSASSAVADVNHLDRAFDGVNQTVRGISDGVDLIGNSAVGAAGMLGAGIGVQGIVDMALADSTLETKIAISTDMTPEQQKQMKQQVKLMTAMYVDEEAALEGVRRQYALNADASAEANEKILKGAATVVTAYPMVDFTELIQETYEIGKELNMTNDSALAMTNTLLKSGFPPEQLDIISEYGKQMRLAGFSAQEIQAVMSSAVATGTWNIDNLLDGVKEARLTMSGFGSGLAKAQIEVVKAAGLSQKKFERLGATVARGGAEGMEAMKEISRYIDGMAEGAAKNDLATLVYGTKWEDQGQALIDSIVKADAHVKDLATSQRDLNEAVGMMEDDPMVQLKDAMNKVMEVLQPLLKEVTDLISKGAEWASKNPELAANMTKWAVGIGLAGAALLGVAGTIGTIIASVATLIATGAGLKNVFGGVGGWVKGLVTNQSGHIGGAGSPGGRNGGTGAFGGPNVNTGSNNPSGGQRRGFFQAFGGSLMNTFGMNPNRSTPESMERTLSRHTQGRNIPRSAYEEMSDMANRFDPSTIDDFMGGGSRNNPTNNPLAGASSDGGREMLQAARLLSEASTVMKRSLANIRCECDCGGGGRNGRNGRGGAAAGGAAAAGAAGSAVNAANNNSRSTSNIVSAGDATQAGRSRGGVLSKLGKVGKIGGIAGLALGGATIINSVATGNLSEAGQATASMAGGMGGAWAGAKVGALAGSLAGPIGTAVGGVAGSIIGGIAGSGLASKAYEGVKNSFDWSGLKTKASEAASSVGEKWDALKEKSGSTWQSIKSSVSENMGSAQSVATIAAGGLLAILGSRFGATRALTGSTFGGMKTNIGSNMNGAKTSASSAASSLKGAVSKAWSSISSSTSSVWSKISSTITSSIRTAVTTASGLLSGLKTTMSNLAEGAKTKIASGVEKVKNFFNGSHATGLGRVPFDGYVAELHKDEAVLTANQANVLRNAGMLKGDGVAPALNMPQNTSEAAGYTPLQANPTTTLTTASTNKNTVQATVHITVDGSKSPQQTAFSIKDELEGWFGSLGDVFPAVMEG